ncbi:MAG: hypothetical protein AAFN81_09065 [Bacteroidota bacterium]
MKTSRKLYQLSLVVLFLLGFAPLWSQSVEVRPAAPDEQVAAGFANPQMSAQQGRAFEQRAQQIVREFVDYYNLLCNPDLDSELRTVLFTELEQLLYSPGLYLQLPSQSTKTKLSSIDFTTATPINLQEVELLQTKIINDKPAWQYRVSLQIDAQQVTALVKLLPFRKTKTFGSRIQEVWEVAIIAWEKG